MSYLQDSIKGECCETVSIHTDALLQGDLIHMVQLVIGAVSDKIRASPRDMLKLVAKSYSLAIL
jgi:hypothetical protein